MTIIEAIKEVLKEAPHGLTYTEIYEEIIQRNLYSFGASNPQYVVNGELRRRCSGIDFPTAHPVKLFEIAGHEGRRIRFRLSNTSESVSGDVVIPTSNVEELLPEEIVHNALSTHTIQLKQQLLTIILRNSPAFFEQLVVELLLKMGYGHDFEAGNVTGGPHDGGIDGIISEDKLGLDLIYVQAKRYSPNNKVSRNEIQAFIGAMQQVNKGVFITTSAFTDAAMAYASQQQQKRIKLIDGNMLAELLIKYEVGVSVAQNFKLYKIDMDYFAP